MQIIYIYARMSVHASTYIYISTYLCVVDILMLEYTYVYMLYIYRYCIYMVVFLYKCTSIKMKKAKKKFTFSKPIKHKVSQKKNKLDQLSALVGLAKEKERKGGNMVVVWLRCLGQRYQVR